MFAHQRRGRSTLPLVANDRAAPLEVDVDEQAAIDRKVSTEPARRGTLRGLHVVGDREHFRKSE